MWKTDRELEMGKKWKREVAGVFKWKKLSFIA